MTYTERIWKMQNSVLCSATSNLSKLCMMKVDIVKSAPSVARLQCSRWSKIHQDSLLGIVNIPVRLRLWGCDVCDLFWPGRFGRWARLGWSSQARDSHHLPVLDFLMFFAWLSSTVVPREMIWEILGTPKVFSSIFLYFLGQDIRDIRDTCAFWFCDGAWHFFGLRRVEDGDAMVSGPQRSLCDSCRSEPSCCFSHRMAAGLPSKSVGPMISWQDMTRYDKMWQDITSINTDLEKHFCNLSSCVSYEVFPRYVKHQSFEDASASSSLNSGSVLRPTSSPICSAAPVPDLPHVQLSQGWAAT